MREADEQRELLLLCRRIERMLKRFFNHRIMLAPDAHENLVVMIPA